MVLSRDPGGGRASCVSVKGILFGPVQETILLQAIQVHMWKMGTFEGDLQSYAVLRVICYVALGAGDSVHKPLCAPCIAS